MSENIINLYVNAEPHKLQAGMEMFVAEWRYVVEKCGEFFAIAIYDGENKLGYV